MAWHHRLLSHKSDLKSHFLNLALALGTILPFLIYHPNWFLLAAPLVVVRHLNARLRIQTLLIYSFIIFYFKNLNQIKILSSDADAHLHTWMALATILSLVIAFLFESLRKKITGHFKFIFFYLGLLIVLNQLQMKNTLHLSSLWLGLSISIIWIMWAQIYESLLTVQPLFISRFFTPLTYVRPIWSFYFFAPTPKTPSFWINHIAHSHQETDLLKKAFKLSIVALIVEFLILQSHHLEQTLSLVDLNTTIKNSSQFSNIVLWKSLWWDLIKNTANFIFYGHSIMAVVYIMGIDAPLNTNKPWLAKNAIDFFQRYNYYYKELLFQIFFFPIFRLLRRFPINWRVGLALFGSVGIGNFLILYSREIQLQIKNGWIQGLSSYTHYFIYGAGLSLLLFPSLYYELTGRESVIKRIPNGFRLFIFLFLFAIFRVFDEAIIGTLSQRLHFLGALVGIRF